MKHIYEYQTLNSSEQETKYEKLGLAVPSSGLDLA